MMQPNPERRETLLAQQQQPAERDLFREGRASAWADRVLNMPDNADVTKRIFNSPNDRARAAVVFGPNNLGTIESRLALEKTMQAAKNALGNSTTVRQMIEAGLAGGAIGEYLGGHQGALEGAMSGMAAVNPIIGKSAVYQAAKSGAQNVVGYVNRNMANEVAKLLTSNDPAALNKVAQMAAKNKRLSDGLRAIGDRVSASAGARGASKAMPPLQLPAPSAANDKPDIPRVPTDQKNGGKVGQEQGFARGGHVPPKLAQQDKLGHSAASYTSKGGKAALGHGILFEPKPMPKPDPYGQAKLSYNLQVPK